MKTYPTPLRHHVRALLCLSLAGLLCDPALAQETKPPSEQLISVSVVKIRPEVVAEWEEMQKSESVPALKRGGLEWRHVWTRGMFGEAYEYHLVSPIANFAQYDGQGPIIKALGEAGAKAHGAKLAKYTQSVRTYALRSIPSLTWEPPMENPPNLAVITWVQVAPGRRSEFTGFIEKEFLPVIKKSDLQGYLFFETIFGGNANEFVSVAFNKNYAELDKGPPINRVLGAEGAEKLLAKLPVGVVTGIQRSVIRLRQDLSVMREPKKTGTQ